ncbi:2OG-Fe dioxygenase-domain-containing protein [Massariosphaeria phaeospora]|uniref:2OG-Fe dioxygenase-domain-containing protein n=1 Tax=Massariosphaeria phaeospora TaxID=100035 RepID=A0A7C8ICA5_9PLEO|nr:2OG-Fe dioxygenase-domain-containing protein [Massariosphaeria phaeospora]
MPHSVDSTPEDIITTLYNLRSKFLSKRAIFVPSNEMINILLALGADAKDLKRIQATSETLQTDPTLPFRRSKNGRFMYDLSSAGSPKLHRLEHQPFILSAEEDFVRHDSGQVRQFIEIEDDLQGNSVLHALFKFKTFMMQGVGKDFTPRPSLDYDTSDFICTLFHLRTVTTPTLVGEPALEGVHSDGVDFTMTTFLGADNMTDDSAVTFVHDNAETNALPFDKTDPKHLLATFQHKNLLDTLLFVDHERKHSLSPVKAVVPEKETTRDMLVFFTRKPVVKGHVSYEFDSLRMHRRLPLDVSLSVV